jgi:hypothetical protein
MRTALSASQSGKDEVGPKGKNDQDGDMGSNRRREILRFNPQSEGDIRGNGTTLDELMAAGTPPEATNLANGGKGSPALDPLASVLLDNPRPVPPPPVVRENQELQVIFGLNNSSSSGTDNGRNSAPRPAGVLKFEFGSTTAEEEGKEDTANPVNLRPGDFASATEPAYVKIDYLPLGYRIPVTLMTPLRTFEKIGAPMVRLQVNRSVVFMGEVKVPFGSMILAQMGPETQQYGDARISLQPIAILFPDGATVALSGQVRSPDGSFGVEGYKIAPPVEQQVFDAASGYLALSIAERLESRESALGTTSSANQTLTDFVTTLFKKKQKEVEASFIPEHIYVPAGTRCVIELTAPVNLSVKEAPFSGGQGIPDGANVLNAFTQNTTPADGGLSSPGVDPAKLMNFVQENPEILELLNQGLPLPTNLPSEMLPYIEVLKQYAGMGSAGR